MATLSKFLILMLTAVFFASQASAKHAEEGTLKSCFEKDNPGDCSSCASAKLSYLESVCIKIIGDNCLTDNCKYSCGMYTKEFTTQANEICNSIDT